MQPDPAHERPTGSTAATAAADPKPTRRDLLIFCDERLIQINAICRACHQRARSKRGFL